MKEFVAQNGWASLTDALRKHMHGSLKGDQGKINQFLFIVTSPANVMEFIRAKTLIATKTCRTSH